MVTCAFPPVVKILTGNSEWPSRHVFREKISQWPCPEMLRPRTVVIYLRHKLHLNYRAMLFIGEIRRFYEFHSLWPLTTYSCWFSHLIVHIWHNCSFSLCFPSYSMICITSPHTDIIILDNLLPSMWWICLWNVKGDKWCRNMRAPQYPTGKTTASVTLLSGWLQLLSPFVWLLSSVSEEGMFLFLSPME